MAENFYLTGTNAIPPGKVDVLWFEDQKDGSFLQFNSAPESPNARCHWDRLSWLGGTLRYIETRHECPGDIETITEFDPPMVFMPRYLGEETWSHTGVSSLRYYEGRSLVCTGNTRYTNTVSLVGSEIYFQTTQTTAWDKFGKCADWDDTHWQERYLFGDLPEGRGLIETAGGNTDVLDDRWDITFHSWNPFPKTADGE